MIPDELDIRRGGRLLLIIVRIVPFVPGAAAGSEHAQSEGSAQRGGERYERTPAFPMKKVFCHISILLRREPSGPAAAFFELRPYFNIKCNS